MKACFKCGIEKPLDAFYKHKRMADGHFNKCKECTKRDVSAHRAAHLDRIQEYDRQRGKLAHRIEAVKRRAATDHARALARSAHKKWAERNPDRLRANHAVSNAIRDGRLHRPACCMAPGCFETRDVQAHHHHYDNPLDVNWLCGQCHKAVHNQHREYNRRRAGSAAQQREGTLT